MRTSSCLRSLLLGIPLVLASACTPPDVGDDDDVDDDDDATEPPDDDDASTPPPEPSSVSGEVIAVDRATSQTLSPAEYAERAGGIVVYVLEDPSDLMSVVGKATLPGPGPYSLTVENFTGPGNVVAVVDEIGRAHV